MASPNKPRFIELNVKQLDNRFVNAADIVMFHPYQNGTMVIMRSGHNLIIEEKPDWLQTQIDAAYD